MVLHLAVDREQHRLSLGGRCSSTLRIQMMALRALTSGRDILCMSHSQKRLLKSALQLGWMQQLSGFDRWHHKHGEVNLGHRQQDLSENLTSKRTCHLMGQDHTTIRRGEAVKRACDRWEALTTLLDTRGRCKHCKLPKQEVQLRNRIQTQIPW